MQNCAAPTSHKKAPSIKGNAFAHILNRTSLDPSKHTAIMMTNVNAGLRENNSAYKSTCALERTGKGFVVNVDELPDDFPDGRFGG